MATNIIVPGVPSAATTVAGPNAYGDAAVVGTGTSYARNDHDHGLPATPASNIVAKTDELLLTTTGAVVVLTYAPPAAGNYNVGIYFRVVTAPTAVTLVITWSDVTGAQTLTILTAVTEAIGSYTLVAFMVNSVITTPIVVTMTAGTASQVYASASYIGE